MIRSYRPKSCLRPVSCRAAFAQNKALVIGAVLVGAALISPSGAEGNVQGNVPGSEQGSASRSSTYASSSESSNPAVEVVLDGKGRINYGKGIVKATGYGTAPAGGSPTQAKQAALGAARADALRTLALTVSSIQVTPTAKVKDFEVRNGKIRSRLAAMLRSPHEVSATVQQDGSASVVVEMAMFGEDSIASVVLPEVLPTTAATPITGDSTPETADAAVIPASRSVAGGSSDFAGPAEPTTSVPSPERSESSGYRVAEPGPTPLSDNGPFTALLVDCRGLRLNAILSPKLMDTTGREVYGTVHVTPEYAVETGAVSYPRLMSEALHSARAGNHPLIVKGLRSAEKSRMSPVVLLEDAERILAANDRDHFLEQTRVIFLLDPTRDSTR